RPRLAPIHHQTPRRSFWRTPMVAAAALEMKRLAEAAASKVAGCASIGEILGSDFRRRGVQRRRGAPASPIPLRIGTPGVGDRKARRTGRSPAVWFAQTSGVDYARLSG